MSTTIHSRQKALKRLAADKAPTSVSQLVMWRVAGGLEWDTIAQLSEKWANRYELTLAQDFVDRLDTLPEGETGRALASGRGYGRGERVDGGRGRQGDPRQDGAGLAGQVGEIPAQPEGPAVACRVRLTGSEALVQVASSDAPAKNWVPFGKFSLPTVADKGKFDTAKFADGLAEGILNRLVRAQLSKGPREKGKLTFKVRIDNASPLILNGLAVLGTESKDGEMPKVLSGIALPPRKQHDAPRQRGRRQDAGPEEGHQRGGPRPERTLSAVADERPVGRLN